MIFLGGRFAPGQAAAAPAVPPAATTTAPAAPAGTIRGTVKAGAIPLPGVAVTAANTLTGKKYATTTDINGMYEMAIPKTGRYVVRAELAAFAAETKEVRITAEAKDLTAEFGMQLASRVAQQDAQAAATQTASLATTLSRGVQSLSVNQGEAGTEAAGTGTGNSGTTMPSLAGVGGGDATDSVAISGQAGQTNLLAGMTEDDVRQRIQDAMEQARAQGMSQSDMMGAVAGVLMPMLGQMGGGPGGGRGGPGGGRGGGGGGSFRNFDPTQPHGAFFWVGGNNALNAVPFSISGDPVANPAATRTRSASASPERLRYRGWSRRIRSSLCS